MPVLISRSSPRSLARDLARTAAAGALCAVALAGCGSGAVAAAPGRLLAVGAESQYANVIAQVGGRYVTSTAIMDNPSTDPHTFEASPSVAGTVGAASLVVQNGLGYDDFMSKIESASPNATRRVIDVQHLLRLPATTPNPHLWYRPGTMSEVAGVLAGDLAALLPRHAAYFKANAARFIRSLNPWYKALSAFGKRHPHVAVATTEPVADFMLQAAGADNLTPFSFQADVMNGVDPAAQSVSAVQAELSRGRVRAFLYNVQVTDSLTEGLLARARAAGIPVVGVYETLPTGYSYQRWMLAELHALERAVTDGVSTEHL